MTENQSQTEYPLLIEGARSYPQALAALSEFQILVVDACRKALESELPKISTAMGIKLSREDFDVRIRPQKMENSDGENASLGLRIIRDTEGWRQYHHLVWEKDGLGASSAIWFQDKTLAMNVSNALKKAGPKPPYVVDLDDSRAAFLMRRVTAEEMAQLPGILQELFREWTRLWQRIGGLKSCKA